MAARTSSSHPIRVDFVPDARLPGGRLGMTFAPGKVQRGALSGDWSRSLDADLSRLRDVHKADLLVTLNEAFELTDLKIPDLPGATRRHGIHHDWLPMPDGGVPASKESLRQLVARILWALQRDQTVVIHCMGGLGRTGLVAACTLVAAGTAPGRATEIVRAARSGTIETPAQALAVEGFPGVWGSDDPTCRRFVNCLLAGAAGDALGAGIEFDALASIRRSYGEDGVRGYIPAYGVPVAITDDTQMTLFCAEGLLRQGTDVDGAGLAAQLRWLRTQGEGRPTADDGWLLAQAGLYHRRAPGNTCLTALQSHAHGEGEEVLNDSKGCGGIMRVAPVGLVRRDAFAVAKRLAWQTHFHPAGHLSAGLFADILRRLAVEGEQLRPAIDAAYAEHRDELDRDTREATQEALALADSDAPSSPETVERLGGGWIAEQALGIALFCALRAQDLRHGLLLAVNHSGDSDSTGSMTGQLLGALEGADPLPGDLREPLEHGDLVEAVARDLWGSLSGVPPDPTRYPTR